MSKYCRVWFFETQTVKLLLKDLLVATSVYSAAGSRY